MAGKNRYDALVIGLGPAGMAVAAMGAEMGLNVAAVESNKIGGECMNVGCIPSKALLRAAGLRHAVSRLPDFQFPPQPMPQVNNPMPMIREAIGYINDNKTSRMFDKVDLRLGRGAAHFVDPHTVAVGDERLSARRIFIATGTRPAAPPIAGLDAVDYLTNENLFRIEAIPESMTIIGGGAIGCEMAQAFGRLGCRCSIVHMDEHLVPLGDPEAGQLLEEALRQEGIAVYNGRKIERVEPDAQGVALLTDRGERIVSQKLLVGAGRRIDLEPLQLGKAGVNYTRRGITVDKTLRTNRRHIYAVGDCNGYAQLSHAAMHQGMIALINAMLPGPMKRDFRKFVVPWTVFTTPQLSAVGLSEKQLREKGIRYRTIRVNHGDYGAAIAEKVETGFVKVFASAAGRIYGASIVGEGSGEMINEWALAIQKNIRLHDVMLLQHSFPTMGFLSKRVAETWMMGLMKSPRLQRWAQRMYRW